MSSPLSLSGGTSGIIYQQLETYRRQMLLQQAQATAAYRSRRAVGPFSSTITLSFVPTTDDGLLLSSTGLDGDSYVYVSIFHQPLTLT